MSPQPILLVDDSPEDRETALRAFRRAEMANPVYCCADGEEALNYLRRRGPYAGSVNCPRPGLILLDLNLPGTDGRQVLAELKRDARLRSIPVVILSTSADERDIDRCYAAGANSYIQKSVDPGRFVDAMSTLKRYWFGAVLLPLGEGAEGIR